MDETNQQSEPDSTKLGKRVYQLRTSKGLGVRALASQAGVDFSWIAKLEQGNIATPGPRMLYKLACALDIEVAELYYAADYRDGLPDLGPYLRAKYDLPDEAIAQLQAHFKLIDAHYTNHTKGSRHGPHHDPA